MGWFERIRAWFSGGGIVRDVSALPGRDAGETREVVRQSGPLKEGQRRLAIRDPRLLPKSQGAGFWGKRPRVMSGEEARRLFSQTLRTRDRNLRDLATDAQQLSRYQLPVWESEGEVAAALGLTVSQLRHYSIHRQRETTAHYVTFAIPKRGGGHRLIHAPKRRLRQLQRQLDALLVSRLPVSEQCHGFRPGRSIASNARPHVGKACVLKWDLQDCFPSIHYGRVRGLLISLGYSYPVATCLAVMMTEPPRQRVCAEGKVYHVPVGPRVCVQGAPTSPGLCNAILLRLDRRLGGLAGRHGFSYTRYADDLTFSGDDLGKIKLLRAVVPRIVRDEGFRIHPRKTRVLRRGGRQRVTGVVVNEQLGLSRTVRRQLRAAIHQLDPRDRAARQRLAGKLAYLQMLNPNQAEPLWRAFRAKCSPA